MRILAKMTWLELKLFLREPLTVLFALVLPLMVLFVMGGVFGNEADADVYRGVGAMNYYVPAYIALVAASVGLISLPTHLAGNRERGVLKRYRASSMPSWAVVGAQVAVTFVISTVSGVTLVVAAMSAYDVEGPDRPLLVIAGFVLVALAFSSLGVLLGALLPSPRSAQALGVMLWFVMLMVGGAGPPPEVLTGAMGTIGDLTPLRHAIRAMQDGWLGLDAGYSWLVVAVLTLISAAASVRFFRWE
ncbi:MAG TPA: ABC transporter permease [Acidimicrobiia bacterium]|nr:ABC transporter permease [Acidimicrobiia bacterium]